MTILSIWRSPIARRELLTRGATSAPHHVIQPLTKSGKHDVRSAFNDHGRSREADRVAQALAGRIDAAYLDRIEALDDQINAFITVTGELALEQAKQAEAEIAAGRYRGPVHGIPFALKDHLRDRGHTDHRAFEGRARNTCRRRTPPPRRRLYEAGAVLLGKLATHEFAHGGPIVRRCRGRRRAIPGTPSISPAARRAARAQRVAAGFVPAALGSDTGGSIRVPAAFCGIAGLKPTYGLVSRYGVSPNSFTFDHCGPLAWTVEDCAILLGAIAGYDARDSGSVEPRQCPTTARRSRTGRARPARRRAAALLGEEAKRRTKTCGSAMEDAIDVLKRLGAQVEDARACARCSSTST